MNTIKGQKISTQPYKGSRDFYPKEMQIRNYIFGIWKDVCKSYGYQEYDGPFLETFDLYAAKSGEELVNEQLYSFEDRGERKIAIRPEMTPTVARMVAAKYKELSFPIRWFSIPNLWRYEKPQRGRMREFFQLNVDIMGVDEITADFEILNLAIDIMKKAGAKEGMFELRINNRKMMDDFYESLNLSSEQKAEFSKALDKKTKISSEDFEKLLIEKVGLLEDTLKTIMPLLNSPENFLTEMLSKQSIGATEVKSLLELSQKNGLTKFIKLDPTIVRGLAYYTGIVFEQFDLNPNNNRAMFGGGRYNDLVKIFIDDKIPATGFGMGDVTFKDFLESWNLLPKLEPETEYFITRWPTDNIAMQAEFEAISQELAAKLRDFGTNVATWPEKNTKLEKQLKYADKNGFMKVLICGEEELKNRAITIKNLENNKQETLIIKDFLANLIKVKK